MTAALLERREGVDEAGNEVGARAFASDRNHGACHWLMRVARVNMDLTDYVYHFAPNYTLNFIDSNSIALCFTRQINLPI